MRRSSESWREAVLPLNHVLIDELGHDRDCHGRGRRDQNVLDLRILKGSHRKGRVRHGRRRLADEAKGESLS